MKPTKSKVDMSELRKAARKVFAYQPAPGPAHTVLKERPPATSQAPDTPVATGQKQEKAA